jgi:hypothetical protein
MANTYVKIGSVDVGILGAAYIEFTSIPSTYTDLVVKISGRTLKASTYAALYMSFNSSTSNFQDKELYGVGSTAGSGTSSASPGAGQTVAYVAGSTVTASTFGNSEIYIANYAGSANKSLSNDSVVENNSATANILALIVNLWSNTAAITSIRLTPDGGDFVQYSTATLYGISKS